MHLKKYAFMLKKVSDNGISKIKFIWLKKGNYTIFHYNIAT